jgi:ribosomal protein L11 methyltransferase
MIELFPEGFEEVDCSDGVELAAYTDPGGEERLWHAFGAAYGEDVDPAWPDRWREFHQPVRVGPFWIGPSWHEAPADAIAIVIDPGRAFGTGGHPSTRLSLGLLGALTPAGLLDIGCGSGILAIAAAKLGFDPVIAVDEDVHAIEATIRNARANDVAIEAHCLDASTASLRRTDVVVANVTREVVERVGNRVDCATLVTSGYLVSDEVTLPSFRRVKRVQQSGWAADLFERTAK